MRPGWDEYFMQIATTVSTRATCPRASVGCVLVRAHRILTTGYNGAPRGVSHCTDVGCTIDNDHCLRATHAEANAIVQAARAGVRIEGAGIYVTASPCWGCFRLIANAGITRIAFGEFYRDSRTLEVSAKLGIELVDLSAASAAPAV